MALILKQYYDILNDVLYLTAYMRKNFLIFRVLDTFIFLFHRSFARFLTNIFTKKNPHEFFFYVCHILNKVYLA